MAKRRAAAPRKNELVAMSRRRSSKRGGSAQRKWEAAETNRLNKAQWSRAREDPINIGLTTDLATLRARTGFEISRNPILEGVCRTFSLDISGEDGPMLLGLSNDDNWNFAFQNVWWNWFIKPEISGKVGGADMLQLWARRLLDSGEFLAQKVSKRQNPGPIAFRLKLIKPDRLSTPFDRAGQPDIILGVRRTDDGEPVEYYILNPSRFGAYVLDLGNFSTVPAPSMIHEFITTEEDQVRGYPWLTTPLQATADLRDLDAQVLDAARAAADQAVVWYTDHPDSEYLEVNEVTDIERRMQQTGPPGWKPMQMKPEQPSTNYCDYRADRMREIGRPIGMPLMMIRLGSEEHNFSSARFDNEIYKRGIRGVRRWLERRVMFDLVDQVLREAELYAAANPAWEYSVLARRPKDADYAFTWQPMVAVDAEKDAQDEAQRLESGTLSYDEACARSGRNAKLTIQQIAATVKAFKKAGLPLPAWAGSWTDPSAPKRTEQLNPDQPPKRSARRRVRKAA
jgi:capsid protein